MHVSAELPHLSTFYWVLILTIVTGKLNLPERKQERNDILLIHWNKEQFKCTKCEALLHS